MCMPNVELRSPFTRRKEEGVGHNHTVPNSKVCVHVITTCVCTADLQLHLSPIDWLN